MEISSLIMLIEVKEKEIYYLIDFALFLLKLGFLKGERYFWKKIIIKKIIRNQEIKNK